MTRKIRPIKIKKRLIGENKPCYIIAEIGSNFNGMTKLLHPDDLKKFNEDIFREAYPSGNKIKLILAQHACWGLTVRYPNSCMISCRCFSLII